MLGRDIVIVSFPHDAAKSGHQFGSRTAQFVVMMKRKFGEHLLSPGSKREQHFAAVILGPRAMDKTSGFQTIYQFHGAMVADFHAAGQFADARTDPGRDALDGKHELVLAPLQT